MKKLIIILFLFAGNCHSQFLGVEVKPTLNQRFGHGVEYITSSISADSIAVLESTILKDSGRLKIYYTGAHSNTETSICLITTDSIGASYTKVGKIIGNGAVVSRNANSSDIVKEAGTYYLYAASGYGGNSVYLYTSTNGYTFTDQGVIFDNTLIPSLGSYGNTGILKDTSGAAVQIGGKYQIYIEANEGSTWMTYLIESTSLTGPWTFVQNISTLQTGGGSYSGGCPIYLDGTYYMFYHYSPSGVNVIPTYLGFATSVDGLTFTQKEIPYKNLEALPYGPLAPPTYITGTSQIADMTVLQVGTKTYMLAEYFKNSDPVAGVIYRWVYKKSFLDLVTDLQTCIGCAGVYP